MNVIAFFAGLSSLPSRWMLALLVCLTVYVAGFFIGQRHVQQDWSAERLRQQTQAHQQSLQAAQAQSRQAQINQKISTEYETQKALLTNRGSLFSEHAFSLRIPSGNSSGQVPAIPEPGTSTDAISPNSLPDTTRDASTIGCEQLTKDAAITTLMLLTIQRWYTEQAKSLSATGEP